MNVRRIKKKQKRKTILVEDFSLCDNESVESISNRVHQRRDILNELNSIKTKVNQVGIYKHMYLKLKISISYIF